MNFRKLSDLSKVKLVEQWRNCKSNVFGVHLNPNAITMRHIAFTLALYFNSKRTLLIPNTYVSLSLFFSSCTACLETWDMWLFNTAFTWSEQRSWKFYLFIYVNFFYLVHFLTLLIGSMRKYFSYINENTYILIEYWKTSNIRRGLLSNMFLNGD